MPSLPIAPDESGGEPRCVATCPSWSAREAHCSLPEQCVLRVPGDPCTPRVRELVALAGRRCDGCAYWEPRGCGDGSCEQHRCSLTNAGESCSRWEAKP